METKDLVLLAVTLVILGEVTYLLSRLPKTNIKAKGRAILVDTSVLMDGRIIGIAATGFIGGTLVIPRSVVGELQLLADGSDSDKRSRARYGLDIVAELQKLENVEVEILQDGDRANEGVDNRLLSLAKQHNAVICTLDYNLNKVAAVEGIFVLNINELAQSLRMSYLPGDEAVIELVQKGQESHQAVGYLADGTMVVTENSSAYLGKTVHVIVTRSLQTAAGKMMFAKRVDQSSGGDRVPNKHSNQPKQPQRQQTSDKTSKQEPKQTPKQTPSQQPKRDTQSQQQGSSRPPRPTNSPRNDNRRVPNDKRSTKPSSRRVDHESELLKLVNGQK
ncbi:MAG: PIN domain-containing protein [Candidatus Saccharimonas sp.]